MVKCLDVVDLLKRHIKFSNEIIDILLLNYNDTLFQFRQLISIVLRSSEYHKNQLYFEN